MDYTKPDTSNISIMQSIIDSQGYKDYLEIGVKDGMTFFSLNVEHRFGVEPNIGFYLKTNYAAFNAGYDMCCNERPVCRIYNLTSDEFFAIESADTWDMIYVDGLHTSEQAFKDIENSLLRLRDNGMIFVHDTNPINAQIANANAPIVADWSGDVWKAIVKVRCTMPFIEVSTCDIPFGLTVLRRVKESVTLLDEKYLKYEYADFEKERAFILNLKK